MNPKEFIEKGEFKPDEIRKDSSLKSNILILDRNFKNLEIYLRNEKGFLKYLDNIVDADKFLAQIIQNFQSSKTQIFIDKTLAVGSKDNQKSNDVTYQVHRVDEKLVEITNVTTPEWVVGRLLVDVKNDEGIKVYPVITTLNNKISINFADGVLTNYNVLFV